MADVMELARAERADLAELLATLTPRQWQAPSLCEGWRVQDVVAHVLSYEELDAVGLARRFARGRFLLGRINADGVTGYAESLLMAMVGRRGITDELGGPGQPTLADRAGG